MMSIKSVRRENLRFLAKSVGGITRLAERLGKTQSQISHLIGNHPVKNIGDKIAAEVEAAFNKPVGWLDREHNGSRESLPVFQAGEQGRKGILCSQVPLITSEEVKKWHQIAYEYRPKSADYLIPTTANVSSFAFALRVQGDSMESATGISFPDNAVIVADPDQVATSGSFVVAAIGIDRGVTLKQLVIHGYKRYLKPLNVRYPILEFTQSTMIFGVVKQMVINL